MQDILWKNKNNHWEYKLDELVQYIEEKSKECVGKYDLCKKIGVYVGFIDALMSIHNIKINLQFKSDYNNSIYYKAIYQDYNWCYQKYITEGLNHEEMSKEVGCKKRVIEKWCTEKYRLTQKYRQKNKVLSKLQSDLIIGSMLGDGHIDRRETQPIFIVSHAKNQKDYLYYKYNILKDLCNIPPSEIAEKKVYFKNTGKEYLCQKQYRLCTRIYDCLKYYRSLNNGDLLNLINEYSFSIWILDDGFRGNSNWELCVAEYTSDDINLAIKLFNEKWNIKSRIQKDCRYLQFDAKSSRIIDEIILKNIPNKLDIIKYKITENKNICKTQNRIIINVEDKDILLSDFCKKNNLNYSRIINRTYKNIDLYDSINMEVGI